MNFLEPKTTFTSTVTRRQLLDLLGNSERTLGLRLDAGILSERVSIPGRGPRPRAGEMVLLWRNDYSEEARNVVVVVPDGERQDLLAWVSTYVSTHRPFTSFFRVLEQSEFERFDLFSQPEKLDQQTLIALCSTAIAEATIQTDFKNFRASSISLQSCQLTFSFAVLRALAAGYHTTQLMELSHAWDRARRAGGGKPPRLSAERAMTFWLLSVSTLRDEYSATVQDTWMSVVARLIQMARHSDPAPAMIGLGEPYSQMMGALHEFEESRSLPRERQLRLLDAAVADMINSNVPEPLVEAFLGYLLARLSNGGFDYIALASDYKDRFPCTALWFSLFAIWQKDFDGLSVANGLGRHVAAHAISDMDILAAPSADVGLQELIMLLDRKAPALLRSLFGAVIDVELTPGVSSRFPNPGRRTEDEGNNRPSTTLDVGRLSRALREALFVLDAKPPSDEPTVTEDLFRESPRTTFPKRRAKKRS